MGLPQAIFRLMAAKLLIESWRGIPHSYAVVNQRQCLELLKRGFPLLRHRDLPFFDSSWKPQRGLFKPDDEAALAAIPAPEPNERFDAALRIACPYDISASPVAARTFVFATSEFTTPSEENFSAPLSSLERGRLELLTPSAWSKAGLVNFGAEPSLVHVIPHGFDPDSFKPLPAEGRAAARRDLGWDGRFVFLHIGAMTVNKGIGGALKAFAIVAARHPEALLVLKGLDALYQSMGMLAKRLRDSLTEAEAVLVGERIVYLGDSMPEEGIARLLQSADAYLSPYLAEGFNMPVLEASACGLPSICTAGGPTDDFTDESFCLRVESSLGLLPAAGKTCLLPSFDSLVAQMERSLCDQAWILKARSEAPAFVKARFTWSQVAGQLAALALPGLSGERG